MMEHMVKFRVGNRLVPQLSKFTIAELTNSRTAKCFHCLHHCFPLFSHEMMIEDNLWKMYNKCLWLRNVILVTHCVFTVSPPTCNSLTLQWPRQQELLQEQELLQAHNQPQLLQSPSLFCLGLAHLEYDPEVMASTGQLQHGLILIIHYYNKILKVVLETSPSSNVTTHWTNINHSHYYPSTYMIYSKY